VTHATLSRSGGDQDRLIGYAGVMSDVEHELIVDNLDLREQVTWLSDVARRSLAAASTAQDAAYGRHDSWIDEAMRATSRRARSSTN
jgi:hypothetical protein